MGRVPNSSQTHSPVLAGAVATDFIERPIKWARVPRSRKTHFPAPPGVVETRLYQKTHKGGAGTELEANKLAGTTRRARSRIYQKTDKGSRVPNSRRTHLPVPSGVVETDFTEKLIKGVGTELEENTHTCRY